MYKRWCPVLVDTTHIRHKTQCRPEKNSTVKSRCERDGFPFSLLPSSCTESFYYTSWWSGGGPVKETLLQGTASLPCQSQKWNYLGGGVNYRLDLKVRQWEMLALHIESKSNVHVSLETMSKIGKKFSKIYQFIK